MGRGWVSSKAERPKRPSYFVSDAAVGRELEELAGLRPDDIEVITRQLLPPVNPLEPTATVITLGDDGSLIVKP